MSDLISSDELRAMAAELSAQAYGLYPPPSPVVRILLHLAEMEHAVAGPGPSVAGEWQDERAAIVSWMRNTPWNSLVDEDGGPVEFDGDHEELVSHVAGMIERGEHRK